MQLDQSSPGILMPAIIIGIPKTLTFILKISSQKTYLQSCATWLKNTYTQGLQSGRNENSSRFAAHLKNPLAVERGNDINEMKIIWNKIIQMEILNQMIWNEVFSLMVMLRSNPLEVQTVEPADYDMPPKHNNSCRWYLKGSLLKQIDYRLEGFLACRLDTWIQVSCFHPTEEHLDRADIILGRVKKSEVLTP